MARKEHESRAGFLLPATGETIEILPGSEIEVECIYREIFEDGMYSKHGVGVRPGDVVVDVGANIGMFYLYLASTASSAAGKPVAYYGFEALPPVFEVLQHNVAGAMKGQTGGGGRSKPAMNVEALLNVGLGNHVSDGAPFTLFPRRPGNSTLNPAESLQLQRGIVDPYFFENAMQYVVPMSTLSEVMEEHGIEQVDLLKVDVEGAELMVLKGIQDVHWSRVRQVKFLIACF